MKTAHQQPGNTQIPFASFAVSDAPLPKDFDYNRLSDVELLGKLIGVQQARLAYTGSLSSVFTAKENTPEKCIVAKELLKRWLNEELLEGDSLNSPQAVRDYLTLHFAGMQFESFVVVFLDSQHRVVAVEEMFRGTLTQTSVYPREVVKASLKHNCAATIFAHNHPSGVAEPSQSDRMLTDALKQALALVDVRVLDHFIVASNKILSFAERGMI
jgi:DNA repair protein RadC